MHSGQLNGSSVSAEGAGAAGRSPLGCGLPSASVRQNAPGPSSSSRPMWAAWLKLQISALTRMQAHSSEAMVARSFLVGFMAKSFRIFPWRGRARERAGDAAAAWR
ncbi:hypothetical protein D3C81_1950530 [compost metagenome]